MKKLIVMLVMTVIGLQTHSQVLVAEDTYVLPLSLALQAAEETMRTCEAAGYRVSVSVVDLAGQTKVLLKGDSSTPHTQDTAYRKAYSVVTFGLNYNLNTSAQVAAFLSKNPVLYSAVLTLPNITPLPGAVAIKAKGGVVAVIGVSAPSLPMVYCETLALPEFAT